MNAMSKCLDELESVISSQPIKNPNKTPRVDECHFNERATGLFEKWDVIPRHGDQPAATSTPQSQSEHTPERLVVDLTEESDSELSSSSTSDTGARTTESLSSLGKSPHSFTSQV